MTFHHTCALGVCGGLDPPPQNPKTPSQTRCFGKILTKNVFFKAFLSDFQTCLRHFSERCPKVYSFNGRWAGLIDLFFISYWPIFSIIFHVTCVVSLHYEWRPQGKPPTQVENRWKNWPMRNRKKINFSSPPTVRSTSLLPRNAYFKTNRLYPDFWSCPRLLFTPSTNCLVPHKSD